ncbi:protein trichome birefringence-like 28 isoform X1 [Punica granatum]|uniref:Protein trichome birefringence-like 28 isoform X1 n=1 Tax=Punica granatum TaxID=22663 RepID=A0A218XSB0_PUNGR|nr:protein trichome birefringence-like 28 isoform X1 [Punica granatum]OWM87411.1 hypothetical protein CDL15_Pgr022522 [Punica granatum]
MQMLGGRSSSEGLANLPVPSSTVVILLLLLGFFMYDEEYVKSIAKFPLSSTSLSLSSTRSKTHGATPVGLQGEPPTNNNHLVHQQTSNTTEQKPSSPDVATAVGLQGEPPTNNNHLVHQQTSNTTEQKPSSPDVASYHDENEQLKVESPHEKCDIFTGEWVLDDATHPLYKEDECKFLSSQVTCLRNGRKDSLYQKWRWQPSHCSLPKFNATQLLEKLRNKRLMYVGDSLNRNQWESMVCMVQSVIPPDRRFMSMSGSSLVIFHVMDYNATIEYYWAPFLVESNSDNPRNHSLTNRIIKPGSIDKHAQYWKGVNFLIFNTYAWWMNSKTTKVLRGSFHEGSTTYDKIGRTTAYKRVLRTWAKWIEKNVDPSQTTVFFNSMSPVHGRSMDWNNPRGIKCFNETKPISNISTPLNVGTDRRLFAAARKTMQRMKIPVDFMDITTLSEYRKDAHTSLYTARKGKFTQKQMANPALYADCTHWCLPGLPDTWNELIFTRIVSRP